jgi:hypothetical protein
VIKACANGGAVKLNVSKVVEHINDEDDIEGLVEKTVASMQANPNYDSKLCPQNQENAIKIMKSETCHYFLLVRSLTEMIGRGLAIIVEWTDEKGKTFSRIFVSVSLICMCSNDLYVYDDFNTVLYQSNEILILSQH